MGSVVKTTWAQERALLDELAKDAVRGRIVERAALRLIIALETVGPNHVDTYEVLGELTDALGLDGIDAEQAARRLGVIK